MATQNVNVGINISDNGTSKKTIKDVEVLHSALKATQATAQSISVAAKAAPQGSQALMSGQDYGRARGSAGATGASARDFANQSQGLGGLVRLYATYAANLFAVSAAFSALKNAADTTALVSGLDKLGAASGRNLGTLSKQLVSATDGAVSLREAMTATAQTSSAGMSAQNILRLANVAKNASIALGVSMPDALNRLSRGIVKLEPELLDELGLFTKIGPATEKYALDLGKTAGQLTDFERRQAFANAVLEEGEQKFAALGDAASNPYDKLLSSLKNVGQSGLEVVNKVLQPAVELLAKSPVALGAGIVAVASVLLRQAIPALSQFREGLEQSAKSAGLAAVGKAGDAKRAREQLNGIIEKKVEESANEQLKTFEKLEAQLYAGAEKGVRRRSSLYQVLKKDIIDITDADIASAEKSVKSLESRARKDPVKIAQAGVERQTLEELKKVIEKEDELVKLKLTNREAIEKNMQGQTQFARIQKAALDYEDKARKQSLVSNAAYNASLLGIRNSFTLLKEEIALSGLALGKFGTGILYIRAGMASLVAVAATLGSVINKAFFIFSTIAAVFGVLDSILSTSSKQAAVFSGAIDAAEGSVANVSRTLDAIKGKAGFDEKTIQSTYALSNALTDLSDSANAAIKSAETVKKSMGVWDKIWDNIFSVINLDVDTKLAKTISEQISSAIKLLRTEGLNKEYEELLKTQLKISTLDPKSMAEAFNKLSDIEKAVVGKTLDSAKMKLGNISSELQSFKSATESAVKSYKELIQSTANTNPLFKLGETFQTVAFESQKLVTQGLDGVIKAFDDLVKNPDKAIAFGDKFVEGFANIRTEFTKQKLALDGNASALQFYEDRLMSVNDELINMEKYSAAANGGSAMAQGNRQTMGEPTQQTGRAGASVLEKEKIGIQQAIATLKDTRIGLDTSAIKEGQKLFAEGIVYALKKGTELTQKALNEAYQKAGLTFAKAAASALSGERRAQEENRLAQEDLKIQLNAIDVNLSLLSVQEKLVAEMQLSNAYQAKANALEVDAKVAAEKQLQRAIAISKLSQGTLISEDLASMSPEARLEFDPIKAASDRANMQQKAQRALIEGQLKSQKLLGSMAERGGRAEDQQKLAQITEQINQQLISRNNILQSISGITTKDMVMQQAATESTALQLKQEQELAPILLARANAQESMATSTGKGKDKAEKEIAVQNMLLAVTKSRQQLELDNKGLQDRQKLLQVELDLITKRFELDKQTRELSQARLDAQIEIKEAEFNAYSALLGYSEQYINNVKSAFEIQKAQAAFVKSSAEATATYEAQRAKGTAQIETISASFGGDTAGPAGQGAIDAIIAEDERARGVRDTAIAQATILLDKNTQIANITKTAANEQARFNEILASTTGLATALSGAFGDIGSALGSAVTAVVDLGIAQEKSSKALDEVGTKWAQAAYSSGENSKEALDYGKEYMSLTQKAQKAEIAGTAKILGASKNMFKEKTVGYKIMAAAEKALHMISIALELKTLGIKLASYTAEISAAVATQVAKTGAESAGFASRLPLYIAEIYASWGAYGPWMVGAAAVFIANKLGAFGGGNTAGSFAPTAEQRQETQGTAMGYDEMGNKVQVRRGVFGDENAKSESIANSLEIIRDNSIDGLAYDNKMLNALINLNEALNSAAKDLFGIRGLRAGSLSGIAEGTNTSGGFLGIGGLFSKSTSKSIVDSGLQLRGTFYDLAQGVRGTINTFETVSTTVKKSGFFGIGGSTRTSVATEFRDLYNIDQKAFQALADTFNYAADLLYSTAEIAGISSDAVTEALKSISIDEMASLRGLTGQDFTKELGAVIGSVLDDASLAIFSSFEKYANFGEGMLETVIRVTDTNTKINQAIINLDSKSVSLNKLYDVTELLAKAAGGLDKFLEQAENFRKSFLTEAEQLVPVQKAVTTEMARLGYSSIDTRDEFKTLVQSLDLSTEAGRTTYQALMNLQDGFIAVTEAAQKEADERKTLDKKLAELGASKEALRQLELDSLYEGNRALQREIWLKEDQIDAAKALQTSLQSVTKTIKSQITSLNDYKLALQSGSSTTLTATQQYSLAKSEIEKLTATITKTATTPEEIEAKSVAVSKLSSATDRFLGLSRTLYASGAQYTVDFNSVMAIVDSVGVSLGRQLTDAEKQLTALETANSFLESISAASKTTAELLQAYIILGGTGVSATSFAIGTNYVPNDMVANIHKGERIIPAADNFKLMTQMGNNDAYSREMLVQISKLNQKIDSLEQTVADGAIINAKATDRNTEQIAQAVVDSSGKTIQANRLQNKANIK